VVVCACRWFRQFDVGGYGVAADGAEPLLYWCSHSLSKCLAIHWATGDATPLPHCL